MKQLANLTPSFNIAHDVVLIRPLTANDWMPFMNWTKEISRTHGFTRWDIELINSKTEADWKHDIQTNAIFFAAFDGGKIVALSRLAPHARYPGMQEAVLEVSADYGHRGIGTLMYKLMRNYMAFHDPDEKMIARILPNNVRSLRAAQKAGLVDTGQRERPTYDQAGYMIYSVEP